MSEEVTMWSESLYDGLYVALRKNKQDSVIKALLQELKNKGHEEERIVQMVQSNVSVGAASKVKRLLGLPVGGSANKKSGRSKAKDRGFFAWLGSLFK
ncbi:MAG: hypothetical protein ACNYPG_02305 [Candidatus Porifericomitaceae bacterium WSBS_2022_MAG_OTU9]